MASIDGLLTLVGKTTGTNEVDIDVSELTTTGVKIGDTVDTLVDGRPLGRGKPLFVQVQLAEDATTDVTFELWTSSVRATNGDLAGTGDDAPVQVASVSFTDDNDAGDARFIHLQDNTRQYLQLRVRGTSSGSASDFAVRAWIDTARITSTAITEAPFVGHESYLGVTNQTAGGTDGATSGLPFGAEGN